MRRNVAGNGVSVRKKEIGGAVIDKGNGTGGGGCEKRNSRQKGEDVRSTKAPSARSLGEKKDTPSEDKTMSLRRSGGEST